MKQYLSFDDVLIEPSFSWVRSRKDVDVSTDLFSLELPIISSNMDSVTGVDMARAMSRAGGLGALHRFWSIEENVKAFLASKVDGQAPPLVSVGLGQEELDRASSLFDAGATGILLDVAHACNMQVVEQFNKLKEMVRSNAEIVVGNFASSDGVNGFTFHTKHRPDAIKVGIGGGSACTTRVVTGCGIPLFGSILDCAGTGFPIIADGGIRNSGDLAKSIAAGASAVMLGRLLAGANESPSPRTFDEPSGQAMAVYRGSASAPSYERQKKTSSWRTPEGESFNVPLTGPVKDTLLHLEAGLRSSMSYVGAFDLKEFRKNVTFVSITPGGARESEAHGKR